MTRLTWSLASSRWTRHDWSVVAEVTRRDLLTQGAAAAGALLLSGTPKARAASGTFDGTIRIAGLGYELPGDVQSRADKELGLRILYEFATPHTMERLVRQEPAAFDIFAGWSFLINPLWPSGNLQPAEIAKINVWNEISPLFKLGRVRPGDRRCPYGQGDAAFRRLYLDPERSGRWKSAPGTAAELEGLVVEWADEKTGLPVGSEPHFCTGVPDAFNLDSFGYNAHVIRKQPEELSWAELLNRRWRGRVALVNDPVVGFQDAGNAARAAGIVRIRDLGDPTRREIDSLFKLLTALKRRKHFHGLWSVYTTAENWMKSRDVVVESMWAVTISPLAALGFPVRQAAPREGYRAFAGFYSISSAVTDPARLRACYDFINWWHSGYAGAAMLRLGYLTAVATPSRRFMSAAEYAYWLEGTPAAGNYKNPDGDIVARRGQVRDGGSFTRRACRIASWNSWPREAERLQQRWFEFASTF
jgi:putative spermidine/putrescine transport system substrate-binding protein